MKLVVFCLFAVTWCALADVSTTDGIVLSRKLREVLDLLEILNKSLQHNGVMVHTPSQDIEECCSVSALACFRTELMKLNIKDKRLQQKYVRMLKDPLTVGGVNFCPADNNTTTSCKSCEGYPRNNTKVFMARLKSLLQKAFTRTQ